MTTTVETLLAQVRRDSGERFSPTRYPYTYACDWIRENPHTVPEEVIAYWPTLSATLLSRAEASRITKRWAAFEGRDDDDLSRVLADAYLRLHGITKTDQEDAVAVAVDALDGSEDVRDIATPAPPVPGARQDFTI